MKSVDEAGKRLWCKRIEPKKPSFPISRFLISSNVLSIRPNRKIRVFLFLLTWTLCKPPALQSGILTCVSNDSGITNSSSNIKMTRTNSYSSQWLVSYCLSILPTRHLYVCFLLSCRIRLFEPVFGWKVRPSRKHFNWVTREFNSHYWSICHIPVHMTSISSEKSIFPIRSSFAHSTLRKVEWILVFYPYSYLEENHSFNIRVFLHEICQLHHKQIARSKKVSQTKLF